MSDTLDPMQREAADIPQQRPPSEPPARFPYVPGWSYQQFYEPPRVSDYQAEAQRRRKNQAILAGAALIVIFTLVTLGSILGPTATSSRAVVSSQSPQEAIRDWQLNGGSKQAEAVAAAGR